VTAGAGAAVVAAGLLALAVVVAVVGRRSGRSTGRLARIAPRATSTDRPTRTRRPMVLVAPLAGLGVAVLVSGWAGVLAGLAVAVGVALAVRRIESPAARRLRRQAIADLPFALDLLASALAAGAPTATATGAVGAALAGPLGERLGQVGRALALGGAPAAAWQAVRDVPGGDRLADAAIRSADSGAGLARVFGRVAADLRANEKHEQEATVQRASVLLVLPLGLCFLPAFVVGGLVPVVASTLGAVLP
jgi:Flp pilus assembly protein TadB